MTQNIEVLEGLERRIPLSVPLAEINAETQKRLRKLATTVRMPGFRPGKVPLKMVEQSYGPQVSSEVIGDAVSRAFSTAVDAAQLRVAGSPRIERADGATPAERAENNAEAEAGDALRFTATFEVFPDVKLESPEGKPFERFTAEIGDAEVDRTIDVLRKQRQSFAEADRAAQDDDRVTIDFVGKLDGVAFDGGTATDFVTVLGAGRMLPDFETGVKGLKAGESRTFPVAFPAEYGAPNLAGKTAEFEATVKKVEAPQLPEVDTEFAKSLGVPEGDVEKLRADIRQNLEREVAQRARQRTKGAVLEGLLGLATLELPKALVEGEQQRMVEQTQADLKQRGIDPAQIPVPADAFKEQAEKRVRLGLVVSEVVKANQLQAKPDQIRKQIEEFAQSYENPGELIRWYYSDRNRLAEVEALVVEQNVVDWVLGQAQVTDKPLSFEELMG